MVSGIDERYAEQVAALLQPPSQLQEYFDKLISDRQILGLKVKQSPQIGKVMSLQWQHTSPFSVVENAGVYANMDFEEGQVLLRDQILFGNQHSFNKMDCFVCSFCYRFIGSIEIQIGKQLYFQSLGISMGKGDPNGNCFDPSKASCQSDSSDNDDSVHSGDCDSSDECSPNISGEKIPLPLEVVESLLNGELRLPLSEKFPLPSVVPCPGDCEETYYCSLSCAKADWESFHSLLCVGTKSKSACREALKQFIDHANETNDIFLLAAKAIAFTILRYYKIKAAHCDETTNSVISSSTSLSLLMEAWKPISMGYKKGWWNCISEPENTGKVGRKELALKSLQFLREAIFDEECGSLFTLEIYGHIVGMFELNNLDLIVESPVDDYIRFITDLPDEEKTEIEENIRPILRKTYDLYWMPLAMIMQICAKLHESLLLSKWEGIQETRGMHRIGLAKIHISREKGSFETQDRDGIATVIASTLIQKGEEITISYINEELHFEERQELLADYDFQCKCSKCVKDQNHLYVS